MPPEKFARFHPIELSDPCYEQEHVRNMTFYSSALRGRSDVSLFVPPNHESIPTIPLVLLLHGVYGGHWTWFQNGGAHRTALQLMTEGRIRPMILIAPSDGMSGDGTAYLPQPERDNEAWVCEDVLDCVRKIFDGNAADAPVFIGGLSMGGYGALRLGAKYADRFKAISVHSAATNVHDLGAFLREPIDVTHLSPEEPDLMYWMRLNRDKLPPIRMDCGTEDPLLPLNRALHAELVRESIPHQYVENRGNHSWPYWRTHVADSLLFFESVLCETGS